MKYFKTKANEEWHEVSDTALENATGNKQPYVRKSKDGKNKYFAICPLCDNPVRLIGLFKKECDEVVPHGRHCDRSISGLADYDANEVQFCPFFSGTTYKGNQRINPCDRTNKLYKLFLEHPDVMYRVFTLSTGIIVPNGLLKETVQSWFANEKWCYYAANKATLPYLPFYSGNSFRLYGRVIREDSKLFTFLKSVQKKYHLVFEQQFDNGCVQVKTKDNCNCPLYFIIQNYHCSKDWKQSFNLTILDNTLADNKSAIKKIKVPVDELIVDNLINNGYSNQSVKDVVASFVK